jgi:RNA polymerase sigma-70 factor (ECF subfamily)
MPISPDFHDHQQAHFRTTQWTLIVAARGKSMEARAALSELCTAYYGPVEAFIRRSCRSPQDARDVTHDFFVRMLDGNGFAHAEPNKGRFRSYLLGCVKHFLSDANDRRMAALRGAGSMPQSIDSVALAQGNSSELPLIDPQGFPPDAYFDRQWAVEVLSRVLRLLAKHYEQKGKSKEFELLRHCLTGDAAMPNSADLCEQLGLTPEAVAMTVHRLRKRFRAAIKSEISETVTDEAEIRMELDYLIDALTYVDGVDNP